MSTLSELWAQYITKNPQAANNPVPFQTPMKAPVIANPVKVTAPVVNKPIFTQPAPVAPVEERVKVPQDWINPKTGQLYTATEYANNVAQKIPITQPKDVKDIPSYAGNAITQPDQSVAQMTNTARNLNNARNDIATGTTDPYGVGRTSGIAYSPAELSAIEKAYAGIYDPVLNDVFTKLDTKQKQDAAILKAKQDLEAQKFATDENIRQYNATIALNKAGDSDKVLSVNDAQALGVPYGTTTGEAAKMKLTPTDLTSSTRTMIEAAPNVKMFVNKITKEINDAKNGLGPAASRWREFAAGKVGLDDKAFTQLRTNIGLLTTLLMRMHVGARGGEYIMKHFEDLVALGKQSPENLLAAIGEISDYADSVISEGKGGQSGTNTPIDTTHPLTGSTIEYPVGSGKYYSVDSNGDMAPQ